MAVTTVRLPNQDEGRRFGKPNVPINIISYDSKSKDLTLYYSNGAVIIYFEVAADVISNIKDIVKSDVPGDTVIGYLYEALSKNRVSSGTSAGKYNYRVDKYNSVIVKDAKPPKKHSAK